MNELSLIPATIEYCCNANIVSVRTSSIIYRDYVRCLCYPKVSIIIDECDKLFAEVNIKELNFSSYNFENVTTFRYMFYNSKVERILGLSSSKKCMNLEGLCSGCAELQYFDLNGLETSNVFEFHKMFFGCKNVKKLDLTNLCLCKSKGIADIFIGCFSLTDLRLRCNNVIYELTGNCPEELYNNIPEHLNELFGI